MFVIGGRDSDQPEAALNTIYMLDTTPDTAKMARHMLGKSVRVAMLSASTAGSVPELAADRTRACLLYTSWAWRTA